MPFRFFETLLDPVAPPGRSAARVLGAPVPDAPPPHTLLGFYRHFVGQARGLFAALFLAGLLVALVDAAIPTMIGRLVSLLSTHAPDRLWDEADRWMAQASHVITARDRRDAHPPSHAS